MCVIIVMKDKMPTIDVLKQCEDRNPHGGGISWVKNGVVKFKKGIGHKEIYNIAKNSEGHCVAHFRISTVGGQPKELCHPFPVSEKCSDAISGESDAVLFHNGHWSNWEEHMLGMAIYRGETYPGGKWSDSRAMAWICSKTKWDFLEMICSDQRVAIHTKEKVHMWGDFKKKDGILYSNLNWEPYDYYKNKNVMYGNFLHNRNTEHIETGMFGDEFSDSWKEGYFYDSKTGLYVNHSKIKGD